MSRTMNMSRLRDAPSLLRDPFSYLIRAHARHGDLYRLGLGARSVVVLNHPQHVDHVFRTHAGVYARSGPLWDVLPKVFGHGLLMTEGAVWLRHRRMLQPFFRRERILAMLDPIVEVMDEALAALADRADQPQPIDLLPIIEALVLECLMALVFGERLDSEQRAVMQRWAHLLAQQVPQAMLTHFLPAWIPWKRKHEYAETMASFRQTITRVVRVCRDDGAPPRDFLTCLARARDTSGAPFDNTEIGDEALTMFIAGLDTTSLGLAWTLALLAEQPRIAEAVAQEAAAVIAHRRPSADDLEALPQALHAFHEGLRLYPPIWSSPRITQEDDTIGGCPVAAGTFVVRMTHVLHRHPSFWHDPERFAPERFLPVHARGRHRAAWVPFGLGRHLCIGRDLALVLSQLCIAMLLVRYRIRLAGSLPLARPRFSLTPADRVPVYLSRR